MNKIKSSPARKYSTARYALLGVIVLTVFNIVMYLTDTDSYYLCSVFFGYYMFALFYDGFYNTLLGVIAALVVLAPYVLAYIFSKRKGGWLIAALVLFALDTLFLVVMMLLLLDEPALILSVAFDLVLHIVTLVLLIIGIKNRKVALMSDEELMAANTAAGAAAARLEGKPEAQGKAPEIDCSVYISDNGKNKIGVTGIVRFEPAELVIATQSIGAQMLIGALLAPYKEKARFAYASVTDIRVTTKMRMKMVLLTLNDGRGIRLDIAAKNYERFTRLMEAHGLILPAETQS